MKSTTAFRRTVALVALLNLGYFGIEFAVARRSQSVSLFADSIDFLEDASVNGLIYFALAWSARKRAGVGLLLSAVLLVPSMAAIWAGWQKLHTLVAPPSFALTLTGAGALAVNLSCAFLLARYRSHSGSLTQAAFLSARNDAVANFAIIGAGALTALFDSAWPDLIVGAGIAVMNLGAAREVYQAAAQERRDVIA